MTEYYSFSNPDGEANPDDATTAGIYVGDINPRGVEAALDPQSDPEEYNGYTIYTETKFRTPAAVSDEQVILSPIVREYIDAENNGSNALVGTQSGKVLGQIGNNLSTSTFPGSEVYTPLDEPDLDPSPVHAATTTSRLDGGRGLIDVAFLYESADQAQTSLNEQEQALAGAFGNFDNPTVRSSSTNGELIIMEVEVDTVVL